MKATERLPIEASEGWHPLIYELHEKIKTICPDYEIHQIKEKFGELRYYVGLPTSLSSDESEKIYHLIDEASEKSRHICELCGQPGELRNNHRWLKTMCDECNGPSS